MASKEVVAIPTDFDDEVLASITSFEDAIALLQNSGAEIVNSNEYGNGFEVCQDNNRLIGVGFVILNGTERLGDFGPYVSLEVVTVNGEKLVINDGSSGIYRQYMDIVKRRESQGSPNPGGGILVEGGLRKSDYFWRTAKDDAGNDVVVIVKPADKQAGDKPGQTFYLA